MATISKSRKKMIKNIALMLQIIWNVLFYILVIFILIRFSATAYELSYQVFGNITVQEAPGINKVIVIEEGTSSFAIADMLEKEGLVVNKYSFFIRTKITISKKHPIMPGTYTLNTSMPYETIIEIITGMESEE